jgi:hypothetical protein
LTLSVDMVTGLRRTRSRSVFSLRYRTWYRPLKGGGLQSQTRCVLTEEDVGALLEVAVHECSRGGVACCRNWSVTGHVLAELGDEMHWIHCVDRRS